jgi:hypothetical protein
MSCSLLGATAYSVDFGHCRRTARSSTLNLLNPSARKRVNQPAEHLVTPFVAASNR